jgi:hypothetical protein
MFEYRVSWETPPPTVITYDWEHKHGRRVWPRLTQEQWDGLPWKPAERITEDYDSAHNQWVLLRGWADTHSRPVRHVKIQQRERFTSQRWVDSQ